MPISRDAGECGFAVDEIRARGILVVSLNMAGSAPEHADLVVTDPVQAGVMAVMAVADTAKVYPNFRGADQYQLLAQIDQRDEVVRKPRPFKAAGTDFESLRPYIPGEDPRNIDWKATARRGTPISRNKQVEKGQQLARKLIADGTLEVAGVTYTRIIEELR